MMVMDLGSCVQSSALVLSITNGKSMPGMLTLDILDPVAIMIFFGGYFVILFALDKNFFVR
jgi:hypothetical protein